MNLIFGYVTSHRNILGSHESFNCPRETNSLPRSRGPSGAAFTIQNNEKKSKIGTGNEFDNIRSGWTKAVLSAIFNHEIGMLHNLTLTKVVR
jgi:hypothetical protein